MKVRRFAAICTGLLFAAGTAHAALVQPFGIGARAAAMGEAVSANATTPFAVHYNPAGLTNIDRPTLTTGVTIYDAQVYYKNFKVTDADGNPIDIGTDVTRWDTGMDPLVHGNIGFAMPINDKFTFGIAAYAPYGFHIEADHNPYKAPLSFNAWESLYGRMAVTPTIAYKFNDKWSFGFGISLGKSICEPSKTYKADGFQAAAIAGIQKQLTTQFGEDAANRLLTGVTPDKTNPDGSQLITAQMEMEDEFNWSWNAGLQYRPTDKLSFGLTYRSRAEGDFKGDFIYRGEKVGVARMKYDHPDQVQGGVRYAFTDRFAMEFDMIWCNWSINDWQRETITSKSIPSSVVDSIDKIATNMAYAAVQTGQISKEEFSAFQAKTKQGMIAGLRKQTLNKTQPIAYKRDWENQIQYKLAGEYVCNDWLTLMGSYVYDPTPVPDDTFDNGWPDTDRHLVNVGAAIQVNDNWSVDLAVQHIRTFDTGYRDDVKGTSENLNHVFEETITGKEGTRVHVDNQGYLWGYSLSVNYRF